MKRLLITDEDIKEYTNRNKEKWIREKKEKDAKLKSLFSSYDYMNWLNRFTADTKGFSDEDFLYFPEKISKDDLDKVNNLELFFEGIEKYADKNYIYPTMYEYQSFYGIKDNVNEVYYKIGVIEGQGGSFFCERIEYTSEQPFIDFNDIMNDKVRDNVKEIGTDLDNMSNLVLSLYNKGVPLEAIKETLDKTISEIELSKEKGKEYKK